MSRSLWSWQNKSKIMPNVDFIGSYTKYLTEIKGRRIYKARYNISHGLQSQVGRMTKSTDDIRTSFGLGNIRATAMANMGRPTSFDFGRRCPLIYPRSLCYWWYILYLFNSQILPFILIELARIVNGSLRSKRCNRNFLN